jgi:alkylation response protein AidB-like acyl-CoA dehydrogenase
LPVAQADGGYGGGAVDLMAAMEAMGEALVVEPLLDHIALATRLIARVGSAAQRAEILPGLMDGSRRATFAYLEPGHRYGLEPDITTAVRHGAQWRLQGEKRMVIGAPSADLLLVYARTDEGTSLFQLNRSTPGIRLNGFRTVDGQRAADLSFRDVLLESDALLGADGGATIAVEEAIDFASALLCSEAVGALQYATDATLDYLKTRQQFGAPIGVFQALQHRVVDMFIACEQARSLAILAACRFDAAAKATQPDAIAARKAVLSSALVGIADAARLISQESVQLHGGMGMTEELKVSHTFRRLTALAQRFGDVDHHLERYAALS